MISAIEFRNIVFKLFNDEWKAKAPLLVGIAPKIYFQGIEDNKIIDNVYWARLSTATTEENLHGFMPGVVKVNKVDGQIFVQLFCPMSIRDSYAKGMELASIARNIFKFVRLPEYTLTFRRTRVEELAPEANKWWRFSVISNFEYREAVTV